ncbi:MAG: hypothetical protein AB7F21_06415 [Desulfuromonadales bacterium]
MSGWIVLPILMILMFYGWLNGRFARRAAERLVNDILTKTGPKKER